MISHWRREFAAKSKNFSKKKVLYSDALELKALKKELRYITIERDILKKGSNPLFQGWYVKYQFVLKNENNNYKNHKELFLLKNRL